MPLLTCPSILMHTSIYAYTVIIKAACIYPSYSSCQTSRKYIYTLCTRCDYCFIPMSYPLFSLFTFTFQYMYIPMFVHLSFSSFLFAILNNSRSLFPSLSCTWCFILLEIGLLSLSLCVVRLLDRSSSSVCIRSRCFQAYKGLPHRRSWQR